MLNSFGQGMVKNLFVREEKRAMGGKAARTIIREYKALSLQVSPEH